MYIFFLVMLCMAQSIIAMDDSYDNKYLIITNKEKEPSQTPLAWYIVNDTGEDLGLRIRFGENKDQGIIAVKRMVVNDLSKMINRETCKLPNKAYVTLDWNKKKDAMFPLRMRFFKQEAQLSEDIDEAGHAIQTSKNNQTASCHDEYFLSVQNLKKFSVFPIFHLVKRANRAGFITEEYKEKKIGKAIERIAKKFTHLGEYTTEEYAK
jgi:hypothetical protein